MIKQHFARTSLAVASIIAASGVMASEKMTTMLVGFPPGGGNYAVTKIISDSATRLGHKNIIEIKAGAAGLIGMNDCVSRVADKNLICMASQAQYVHSITFSSELRKFDPEELTYVKAVAFSPTVLVTSSKNIKTIPEIIADTKNPTSKYVSFASGAQGLKVLSNWFLVQVSASNSVIVDYKGTGPAIIDVMGGHVDYAFVPYTAVHSQVSSGLLRVVAMVGKTFGHPELNKFTKIQQFVPTMDEDTTMFGFVMGPNVDKEIVNFYNNMLTNILNDVEVHSQFEAQGIFPVKSTLGPNDFRELAKQERQRTNKQLNAMPK